MNRLTVALSRKLLKQRINWQDEAIITEYESAFASWNESAHAFAFMGGRVALSAAIHALGLGSGDEVIIPGFTCIVVPNAFEYAGVKPVYADIELDTYGLSAQSFLSRITPNTKAVVLQHLFGLVSRDYEAILDIARKHNIKVIEDCAHATGAVYKGKKVGNAGDVAFYSSEMSKIFNTIQGGIATTNDPSIAAGLQAYKDQASFPSLENTDKLLHNVAINYYSFKHRQRWVMGDVYRLRYYQKSLISTSNEEIEGIKPANYGCRMPAPIAALGLNQLKKIDHFNEERRAQALKWNQWCNEQGYSNPMIIKDSVPVWLRYPILVAPDQKKDTSLALREHGIQPGVWFISHLHPKKGNVPGCPNADIAVAQCINLPTLL